MKQLKILEPDDALWILRKNLQKNYVKNLAKNLQFSEYFDSSDDENNLDEIDQYFSYHEKEYPKLSILSAFYLSIPASSASIEREFSTAGLTISEQRTNLNPETLE
ncbi:18122_t:CDS:2, partial [Gigaspora margarita]